MNTSKLLTKPPEPKHKHTTEDIIRFHTVINHDAEEFMNEELAIIEERHTHGIIDYPDAYLS